MKIGLVIQGPILGGGLTGATYGEGKTNAPISKFKPFNAIDTIRENINQGIEYFDQIVLSTWKEEPTSALRELFLDIPKIKIIENDDPTPNPKQKRIPVPGIPYLHQSNKVRMFHSTRKGLESLKNSDVTHAVKIRTDQTLDLGLLHKEFLAFSLQAKKKLFIPSLREKTPWIISDFYFGGPLELLESICRFVENSALEFHNNVHNDFFFKAYFMLLGMFEDKKLSSYFINTNTDPVSLSTDRIIRKSIEEIWHPGSRELYESMVWRGNNIEHIQEDSYFQNSANEFNFRYEVSPNHPNTNFRLLFRNVFDSANYVKLFFNCLEFETSRAYRKMRNLISRYRDKYGLRF